MLLDVRSLNVSYGPVRALRNVSLQISAGEVVCVLGANGAGKTSLLAAIVGLIRPVSGSMEFDARPLDGLSTADRVAAGLAIVPEGRRILVSLTVEENLLLGACQRRDKAAVKREVDDIFDRFPNLAERRHLAAATLSGGEQQMLAIGRAMLAKPKLMLLDEPSLGLSPLFVTRTFDLIAELNRAGTTILLVEQNTRMALRIARRAYVLQLGEVVTAGPSADLLRSREISEAYLGAASDGAARSPSNARGDQ